MKTVHLVNGEISQVDDDVYMKCCYFLWHRSSKGYAVTSTDNGQSYIALHNFVLDLPSGSGVDHIDRDKLNNVRTNLRIATNSEQGANRGLFKNNTSGYKGVSAKITSSGKFKYSASIKVSYKSQHIGYFNSPEEAAKAYDERASIVFGDYAALNFPIEKESD